MTMLPSVVTVLLRTESSVTVVMMKIVRTSVVLDDSQMAVDVYLQQGQVAGNTY